MMILLVYLKMLRQIGYPRTQKGNLNLRGSRIVIMGPKSTNYFFFLRFF